MKEKIMILIFGLLLVITGCSNDDESIKDADSYLTTITVKKGSDSRISYLGDDVLWSQGDIIALSNISDTASYYLFRLTDGAGTTTGTFQAIDLLPFRGGKTYMVYYPYNKSQWNYKGRTTPITSFVQHDDTRRHLSIVDLMVSEPMVLDTSFDSPSFTLKHVLGQVQFNVKNGNNDDIYLSSIIMESASGEPCFASSFRQEPSSGDFVDAYKINYDANNLCVGVRLYERLVPDSYKSFWLLTLLPKICDLKIKVIFTYQGVSYTVGTDYTPTNILESGKKYEKNLILTLNRDMPNYSSLVVEP